MFYDGKKFGYQIKLILLHIFAYFIFHGLKTTEDKFSTSVKCYISTKFIIKAFCSTR